MRFSFIRLLAIPIFIWSAAQAQNPKSVIKLEAILQRYTEKQVHDLLQKQLADLGKTISQHETFERRDALEQIKDTVSGTGFLLSDGAKLYIVTAKHLIKATQPIGALHREVITDFLTAHLQVSQKTNDINLLNFVSMVPEASPVVFSDDKTDVAIISLQQRNKKLTLDYIKQKGAVGVPIQSIGKSVIPGINTTAVVSLLRKLQTNEKNPAFNQ